MRFRDSRRSVGPGVRVIAVLHDDQPAAAGIDQTPVVVAADLFDDQLVVDQIRAFDHVSHITILGHEMRFAGENRGRRAQIAQERIPRPAAIAIKVVRHAIKTVRIHRRGVVLQVVVGDVDGFRREQFRRCRQVGQLAINRVQRLGVTRVVGSVHHAFIGVKDARIVSRHPVGLVLDADPGEIDTIRLIRIDGIIPILRETGVVKSPIGVGFQRASIGGLAVALQKCRRRPRTHVDRNRMAQYTIGVGNNHEGGGIKRAERARITPPIPQAQHRDVQPGKGVGVNLLRVRMAGDIAHPKTCRAAKPFNGLIYRARINYCCGRLDRNRGQDREPAKNRNQL